MNNLKKVEIHLHLDGSVRPTTISELLNISPDKAVQLSSIQAKCSSLSEYLEKFSLPLQIMQTKENLQRIAQELAEDLIKDNVIYAEIRFAPNKHRKNCLSLDDIITAVLDGLKRTTLKANLILCMMRGDDFYHNLEIINLAKKYLNKGVVALDLAGDEALYPTDKYAVLFDYAKSLNIPFTIHAGEADGPKSIEDAIMLGATRIGHGIRAIENEDTLKLLKEKNITLEICPQSNIDTNIYECLAKHPIKKLYEKGIKLTINTDNRTVSNTTLSKTYQELQTTFNFTIKDFQKINELALECAFISKKEKQDLLKKLHDNN